MTKEEIISYYTKYKNTYIEGTVGDSLINKFIEDLKKLEDNRKTSFQLLDMLTIIIEDLNKYHSYKSMVKELENIRTVLKNDWSGIVSASVTSIPVPNNRLNDSYWYEKGIEAGKKMEQEMNKKTINNAYYCEGCKKYVTIPHQCSNLTTYG